MNNLFGNRCLKSLKKNKHGIIKEYVRSVTEISAAAVVNLELVAALPDPTEGESVEAGQEDQGHQVEDHQGDGGRDQAVGGVHPERGGQDVGGEGPRGGERQVVV